MLSACSRPSEHSANPTAQFPVVQVRVQPVERESRFVTEEVAGTVRAKLRATLEAKVSGRIEEMPISLGQRIKAGDLIARLDAREIQARLEHAQAAFEQANRDWNRISALFKGQAVTRAEYDTVEARERMADAAVAEARAMVGNTEIRAPFDGVVSRKWTERGDLANPGKSLVEVEGGTQLQVEADIPESLVARVGVGTNLPVRVDEGAAHVEGRVSEIAPAADPASRTVQVKVDLAEGAGLIPGRFVRLLIPGPKRDRLSVPVSSLVERGQLQMIFVITNHVASMHLVRSGKVEGSRVEMLSGVEAGAPVVVEGAHLLKDGQPVEVK